MKAAASRSHGQATIRPGGSHLAARTGLPWKTEDLAAGLFLFNHGVCFAASVKRGGFFSNWTKVFCGIGCGKP
jgi:hypothetical protein